MQKENTENLAQIREEHSKRVFTLYESKAKSFRTIFTGLISFALAFFFLILLPYFFIQARRHAIAARIEMIPATIAEKNQTLQAYENVADGIQTLRNELAKGPATLRQFIMDLSAGGGWQSPTSPLQPFPDTPNMPVMQNQAQQMPFAQAPMQQSLAPLDTCDQLGGDERTRCKVRSQVMHQFDQYAEIMNRRILAPLQAAKTGAVVKIDTTAIRQGLDSLRAGFNRKLASNADFWRTFAGKGSFFVSIDEDVQQFWKTYGATLGQQSDLLKQEVATLVKARQEFEKQITELQETEKEVTARLSHIESPLGKLPVGLNESILVYPLALAIGFWICCSLLGETTRLRRTFHTLYQQNDPQKLVVTDQQIALVAPLWLDPIDTSQNQAMKRLVLAAPFVLFVVACAMIVYLWTFAAALSSTVQSWVYALTYVLSLGIFWQAFRQLQTVLRNYSAIKV